MVFGAVIGPNEKWAVTGPCSVQLFSAALGSNTLAEGESVLCVRTGKASDKDVCTLRSHDGSRQILLNKMFSTTETQIEFSVRGVNQIHVVGSSNDSKQLVRINGAKRKKCSEDVQERTAEEERERNMRKHKQQRIKDKLKKQAVQKAQQEHERLEREQQQKAEQLKKEAAAKWVKNLTDALNTYGGSSDIATLGMDVKKPKGLKKIGLAYFLGQHKDKFEITEETRNSITVKLRA